MSDSAETISSATCNTCVKYSVHRDNIIETEAHDHDYHSSGDGYQQQEDDRCQCFPWLKTRSHFAACVVLVMFIVTLIIGCSVLVRPGRSFDDGTLGSSTMSLTSISNLTEKYKETSMPSVSTRYTTSIPFVSAGYSTTSDSTSNSIIPETDRSSSILLVSTGSTLFSTSTIRSSEKPEETSLFSVSDIYSVPTTSAYQHKEISLPISSLSTIMPLYSTIHNNPLTRTTVSSTTTSMPSFSTNSSIQSASTRSAVSTSSSVPSNGSSDSSDETADKSFNNTIENLFKYLPCKPRPVKLTVQQALGNLTKDDILDNSFYPSVIVVMLCDRKNSYCGNHIGVGDVNTNCTSALSEKRTHTVKYYDSSINKLVHHSIETIEDVECRCMEI